LFASLAQIDGARGCNYSWRADAPFSSASADFSVGRLLIDAARTRVARVTSHGTCPHRDTFVKGNTDNSYPAATYAIVGNIAQAHKVIVTFSAPLIAVSDVTVTPGAGGTISNQHPPFSFSNSQVTVNLTGVSSPQTLTINLLGVSDGARSGDVAIPMSVLLGDVTASGRTDNGDAIVIRNQSGDIPNLSTFRADLNCSGRIDNGDAIIVRNNSGMALP